MKNKILIIEDSQINLNLLKRILIKDYDIISAMDGGGGKSSAENEIPDLILLDLNLPDFSGLDVCRLLKNNPKTKDIPIIFITGDDCIETEVDCFNAGAVDFIKKPFAAPVVRVRVKTHLSLVDSAKLKNSYYDSIKMLAEAGHYNDTDTGLHIWRMAKFSSMLAELSGWDRKSFEMLNLSATMHDTGKIGIPSEILKKNGPLTPDEWVVMKTHAVIGYNILRKSEADIFQQAAEIALNHHEKWDGSGYPNGLKEENIPESARIVAICDVFDALLSKRPYKTAWILEDVVKTMQEQKGKHFDPRLLDLFLGHLDEFIEAKNKLEYSQE